MSLVGGGKEIVCTTEDDVCVDYPVEVEDKAWVGRCDEAILNDIQDLDTLHTRCVMGGFTSFHIKGLMRGAILEFDFNLDRDFFLTEARISLEEIFDRLNPCTNFIVAKSFLLWVRLWQVLLGAWNRLFFAVVGNKIGRFVRGL